MSYTTLCEVRWALSDQVLQQSAMENVMDMKLPLSAERHWQAHLNAWANQYLFLISGELYPFAT